MALIIAGLWKLWALVLPFVGPWLTVVAPLFAWLPGWSSVRRTLRVVSYVAVLGTGAWGAVKVMHWWDGDKITVAEAQRRAVAASKEAEIAAKANALAQREAALSQRVEAVEAAAAELESEKRAMEDARATALASGRPIGADDPWLLEWAKRGR